MKLNRQNNIINFDPKSLSVIYDLRNDIKELGKVFFKYEKNYIAENDFNIEIFDKYILQLIEELAEAYWEESKKTKVEELEELIDCLGYCVTMFSLLPKSIVTKFTRTNTGSFTFDNKISSYMQVTAKLINIRRLFPERKWHKAHKEFSKDEKESRLGIVFIDLYTVLIDIITLILDRATKLNRLNVLNDMIKVKRDFILSLQIIE